jgi:HPt (histidine-containing phosphotransfer) domain-containing protein
MSATPLYDLEPLRQIAGGDEAFIQHMLGIFDKLVQETNDTLQSALNETDWEKAAKAAHKIKPSLDQLRIESLRNTVREVEAFPETNDAAYDIKEKINELMNTLNKVNTQLKS